MATFEDMVNQYPVLESETMKKEKKGFKLFSFQRKKKKKQGKKFLCVSKKIV